MDRSVHNAPSAMTTSEAEIDAFRGAVRRRRMYFEVAPELSFRGSERLVVGYEVRLWAVHANGARAFPGCAKCGELHAELRRIASWALADAELPARVEIQPPDRRLYQSVTTSGCDEIALTMRLLGCDGYDRPAAEWGDRALRDLRRRLKALGFEER